MLDSGVKWTTNPAEFLGKSYLPSSPGISKRMGETVWSTLIPVQPVPTANRVTVTNRSLNMPLTTENHKVHFGKRNICANRIVLRTNLGSG